MALSNKVQGWLLTAIPHLLDRSLVQRTSIHAKFFHHRIFNWNQYWCFYSAISDIKSPCICFQHSAQYVRKKCVLCVIRRSVVTLFPGIKCLRWRTQSISWEGLIDSASRNVPFGNASVVIYPFRTFYRHTLFRSNSTKGFMCFMCLTSTLCINRYSIELHYSSLSLTEPILMLIKHFVN